MECQLRFLQYWLLLARHSHVLEIFHYSKCLLTFVMPHFLCVISICIAQLCLSNDMAGFFLLYQLDNERNAADFAIYQFAYLIIHLIYFDKIIQLIMREIHSIMR